MDFVSIYGVLPRIFFRLTDIDHELISAHGSVYGLSLDIQKQGLVTDFQPSRFRYRIINSIKPKNLGCEKLLSWVLTRISKNHNEEFVSCYCKQKWKIKLERSKINENIKPKNKMIFSQLIVIYMNYNFF